MHYYKFEIATWHLHTSHLSLIEEAVYFRLINFYYDTETPIPQETQSVIRRLRLTEYADVVASVLAEFFVLHDDGWHQKHCDQKIIEYHDKAKTNKTNGLKGGRPKNQQETQSVNSGNPSETLIKNNKQGIKNKELKIINEENLNNNKRSRGTQLPIDWMPTIDEIEYCKLNRPDLNWKVVAESFRDYWIAQPGVKGRKTDWFATWRNWVRNQRRYDTYTNAKDKSRREAMEILTGKKNADESIIDIN